MSGDPFSLVGKRVLVTGASSGIGRQVAMTCAAAGATIVLTGRNPQRLAETELALEGTDHVAIAADLTHAESRIALANGAGTLDGLVHCAGIAGVRLFRQLDQRYIDEDFAINFDAPVLLTQRLLARKQLAQGASIVFLGSFAAHIGAKGSSIYSASKGALIPAARALAQEVGARFQMRVNVVSAYYVESPMVDRLKSGLLADGESLLEAPLGPGRADDVANGVVYLLADASRWITRSVLRVDGGMSCKVSMP